MKIIKTLLTQKVLFPIVLALIGLIIAFANYTPNTFLTGWDTLHPEFNFPLAFERVINGVWRADQGLGTVAIQSHMAELPRIFTLWILSFIFPLESLRYITMLTPLVIGPLGVYFLTNSLIKNKKYSYLASFLASLSYLMSLGTVQHFVVPLEMFALHFAFLPWAFLFMNRFLQTGSRKFISLFALNTLFLIPQAHTATLLYVYILSVLGVTGAFVALNFNKKSISRAFLVIVTTLLINAYIIFPNIYAAKNHGQEVQNSRINRFFSQEAFAKNQQFGNVENAAIAKSFLFDWQLYDFNLNQSVDVVSSWKKNLENPFVLGFGYLVFLISALGGLKTILKRDKKAIVFLPISILAFLMLLNGTFPMTWVFSNLSVISETLKEALRFPFTKFSILYMLGLSIFFAFGIQFILEKIDKNNLNKLLTGLITAGFIFYFLPAFQGTLVSPAMRVSIPDNYFRMFEFFNSKSEDERIAVLPIHSFWGWVYNDWKDLDVKKDNAGNGYQGAGFLQFGIKQPLLDRDHDRWSQFNEQYQREMKYAIYSQNVNLIRDVLNKYDVKWILFDTSVTNLSGYQNETLSWQIPDMLGRFEDIRLSKKFGENLYVYEVLNSNNSRVEVFEDMPDAGPLMAGSNRDRVFAELKDYKTKNILSKDFEAENYMYDEHFIGKITSSPIAVVNGNSPLSQGVKCSGAKAERSVNGELIRYESENGALCDYFAFPNLSHEKSYVVTFETRNVKGFPLQVYICNDLSLHCNQTIYLKPNTNPTIEAFVIPAYYDYGTGHTININNFSIKGKASVNELLGIKIYEYTPPSFTSGQNRTSNSGNFSVLEQNQTSIIVGLKNIKDNSTLTLSERFHKGWNAYVLPENYGFWDESFPFLRGEELVDHNTINNWKNGWEIDSNMSDRNVAIIFMPQYLLYMGLILGGLPLASLFALFFVPMISGLRLAYEMQNEFFNIKAEALKGKIMTPKPKSYAFPYSINLVERKYTLQNFLA